MTNLSTRAKIWSLLILGLIIAIVFLPQTENNMQSPPDHVAERHKRDNCDSVAKWAPKAYAEQFIKKDLKNPRSAKFSGITETREIATGKCTFRVTGWVEATNSFNATLRQTYIVEIKRLPNDKWELLNKKIA